jgi:hypothetical protein
MEAARRREEWEGISLDAISIWWYTMREDKIIREMEMDMYCMELSWWQSGQMEHVRRTVNGSVSRNEHYPHLHRLRLYRQHLYRSTLPPSSKPPLHGPPCRIHVVRPHRLCSAPTSTPMWVPALDTTGLTSLRH